MPLEDQLNAGIRREQVFGHSQDVLNSKQANLLGMPLSLKNGSPMGEWMSWFLIMLNICKNNTHKCQCFPVEY